MVTQLARNGWLLAWRGLIAVLFGLAALRPGATLTALVLLFGAYALADGLLALTASWLDRHALDREWVLLSKGLAGITIGALTYLWPSVTARELVFLIAAWTLLTGAFETVGVLDLRNVVKRERQMAWNGLIERQMLRAR